MAVTAAAATAKMPNFRIELASRTFAYLDGICPQGFAKPYHRTVAMARYGARNAGAGLVGAAGGAADWGQRLRKLNMSAFSFNCRNRMPFVLGSRRFACVISSTARCGKYVRFNATCRVPIVMAGR